MPREPSGSIDTSCWRTAPAPSACGSRRPESASVWSFTSGRAARAAAAAGGTSARRGRSWATSSRACGPASGSRASRRPRRVRRAASRRPSTSTRRPGCTAKVDGVLGDKPIDANTEADYRWRLHPPPAAVLRRLPAGRDRPRAVPGVQGAQAAGGGRAPRGARGRRRAARPSRPAGAAARAGVDPQADRHARGDPRRGDRGRATSTATRRAASGCGCACRSRGGRSSRWTSSSRCSRPPRSRTRRPTSRSRRSGGDRHPRPVARLAAAGMRPSEIAAELGLAKATVSFHLPTLGARTPAPYIGRARDRRDARPQRRAGQRAVRHADRATSGCTTPTARASGSPTPRPRPASARSR